MNVLTTRWFLICIAALSIMAAQQRSFGGNAIWLKNPASDDWNTAANWRPNTVPNGSSDVASFATSNATELTVSTDVEVSGLEFHSGASPFTITAQPTAVFTISGAGISNNSGNVQTFVSEFDGGFGAAYFFQNGAAAGKGTVFPMIGTLLSFSDSSTADQATITLSLGGGIRPGDLFFFNDSSAGEAQVEVLRGGEAIFNDSSTAADAVLTVDSGGVFAGAAVLFGTSSTAANATVTCSEGGGAGFSQVATAANGTFTAHGAPDSTNAEAWVTFGDQTTADNATFIINGGSAAGAPGAELTFFDDSTAANASLTANGGVSGGKAGAILFKENSLGGTASIALSGSGRLDISNHTDPGVTVGSVAGNGLIYLGGEELVVGSNNLDSSFSGMIKDSGTPGGALSKIGPGTLTLSGASTYARGTSVEEGTLLVKTGQGSATGTGPVQVDAGTFGGRSNISGAVTIGSGSGPGAYLAPGINGPGVLVIRNALTFQADGSYLCDLNVNKSKADAVVSKGVTIASGAQFTLNARGNQSLPPGTVFMVIDNRSHQDIRGTFSNLPDHSTLTAKGNTFQVSYEGGDGNDLTLTVIP